MKVRHALVSLGLITGFYLIALIWVDSKNHVFVELPKLIPVLPILMGLALVSYLVRYLRWYWLLCRAEYKTKFSLGFLAYLSGFAFTATPGKVGELVRIRYLTPQGVPPWQVLAAFVYERAVDLIVVLLLATLAIRDKDLFAFAVGFVAVFLAILVFAAFSPSLLTKASAYVRLYQLKKLARICLIVRDALSGCRIWATAGDSLVSMILGILAWSLTSYCFVLLLRYLGVSLPTMSAMAIYPLAMLAGAASMLPGGVGTTEVTLVALLSLFDVPVGISALAAIGIRFASMWFAVLCGFVALISLEFLGSNRRCSCSRF